MASRRSDLRTRYRLLVVDDDPETHRLVRTWFDGQPYDILGAGDGKEGLRQARSERRYASTSFSRWWVSRTATIACSPTPRAAGSTSA